MTSTLAQRLEQLGITVTPGGTPRGMYVPYVVSGNLVFISGQGPRRNGEQIYSGKVGVDLSLEEGQAAARLCAINVVSHLASACGGDLGRVRRVVRITGLVNCAPDFTGHARVIDGASSLLHELFEDIGIHSRLTFGAGSLPSNMAVELEGVFEID